MRRKRYSVEQILARVQLHEAGMSLADIPLRLRISEATFYRWKKEYGGLEPSQVRGLKQLRDENTRLKRLVVDVYW